MHRDIRRFAPIVVVALAILAALWYLSQERIQENNGPLKASGTIETTQVAINPEIGGRVEAVLVKESDPVTAGQILVQLDSALLEVQRSQAQAGLALAQAGAKAAEAVLQAAQAARNSVQAGYDAAIANRDLAAAGALEEQLQAARAQVAQAEANLAALRATLNTTTAGVRPEEISAARLRLEQAWRAYFSLNVVLSEDQAEKARLASSQADENLAQAQTRLKSLQAEPELPASALETAQRTVSECSEAQEFAREVVDAIEDPDRAYALQIEAARMSWDIAARNLSQAQARQDYLESIEDLAEIALDAAEEAVEDAQDLEDAAQEAYEALSEDDQERRLEQAWEEVEAAQRALNGLARPTTPGSSPSLETLLNQIDAARAARESAQANLALLERGARSEQLAAAEAHVRAAQAQVDAAEAQITAAKIQAEMAQAQVDQAQAALEGVEVQIGKLSLQSPITGVVLTRSIEPGEVASPGASLLILGQLESLTITVYLPEDRYGAILLGQQAEVSVDSYPGEVFQARVVHIADQAEFTPRNVQTAEGRRTTVFAVRLAITNEDGKLKPGMPADVLFEP
jgi:multidrug resistance efflux pump